MDRSDLKVAAVILLIGSLVLVDIWLAVTLLPSFLSPHLSSEDSIRMTQSSVYWRGEARPFAILEHSINASTGQATIMLQNYDASGAIIITKMTVGDGNFAGPVTFHPGEIRSINVSNAVVSGTNAEGTKYEVNVSIAYTNPQYVSAVQYGKKPLIGRYS